MNKIIEAINLNPDNDILRVEIDIPKKCPQCGVAYSDLPLIAYYLDTTGPDTDDITVLFALFFCPTCEICFLAKYLVAYGQYENTATLLSIHPKPEALSEFSSSVQSLSPRFVKIYQQSEQAENSGLSEICGMGYRKVLEFLVKDYALYIHPDKRTEIESSFLGKCIADYIDNDKIKTLATASAWLGNDETHYKRKHQDYNVQDLKRFIRTVVAYTEYELNYSEALELLSNPQ